MRTRVILQGQETFGHQGQNNKTDRPGKGDHGLVVQSSPDLELRRKGGIKMAIGHGIDLCSKRC